MALVLDILGILAVVFGAVRLFYRDWVMGTVLLVVGLFLIFVV